MSQADLMRPCVATKADLESVTATLTAGALILTGTIFYWHFEDWTIIEALYFSVVTLATVGFGDFTPTTAGTQIFTIIYILTGLDVLVAFLTAVASHYVSQRAEGVRQRAESVGKARERLSARRHEPG